MKTKSELLADAGHKSGFTSPLRLLLATTAVLWMGAAQAQIGGNAASQKAALRFKDFFDNPVGPGGLVISNTLRGADGQVVRLVGYMVQQEHPVPGRFLLAQRPVQMSEHADGEADDLPPATALIRLDPSQQDWLVPHVRGLVSVSGTLRVGRDEALDGRVSWVQLQMEPESTRSMNAGELANYLHHRQHTH
jgi:cytochrome c551/c552